MQCHQPPNYQLHREQDAPNTMASVSLESLCTNNPSSLQLILVWDFVTDIRKTVGVLVVVQNLKKKTLSVLTSHDWLVACGDIKRRHVRHCLNGVLVLVSWSSLHSSWTDLDRLGISNLLYLPRVSLFPVCWFCFHGLRFSVHIYIYIIGLQPRLYF